MAQLSGLFLMPEAVSFGACPLECAESQSPTIRRRFGREVLENRARLRAVGKPCIRKKPSNGKVLHWKVSKCRLGARALEPLHPRQVNAFRASDSDDPLTATLQIASKLPKLPHRLNQLAAASFRIEPCELRSTEPKHIGRLGDVFNYLTRLFQQAAVMPMGTEEATRPFQAFVPHAFRQPLPRKEDDVAMNMKGFCRVDCELGCAQNHPKTVTSGCVTTPSRYAALKLLN